MGKVTHKPMVLKDMCLPIGGSDLGMAWMLLGPTKGSPHVNSFVRKK